jgi:parallel beta-helix repeat protein
MNIAPAICGCSIHEETEMETELKGTYRRRLTWALGALAVAVIASVFSARPQASELWVAECGAQLSGDETYILVGDLHDCGETLPALTVVGPAKLRLNGHTVGCELDESGSVKEGSIGILLEGLDAEVVGGGKPPAAPGATPANLVTGCEQGVVLRGEGDHLVQGVTVTRSTDGAFVVESDKNKLVGNLARQVEAWGNSDTLEGNGFVIAGNKNEIVGNVAADVENEEDGAGFAIEGNENILEHNISKDNVAYGYLVSGHGNVLNDNTALKNEMHGFFVAEEAEGNLLKQNKSFENGDEPQYGTAASGFHVEGSSNKLEENLATRNGIYGIHLTEGATDNVVSRNTASDSFGFAGLASGLPIGTGGDLVDDNFNCGTNEWYRNVFGIRSASCIR